MCPDIESLVGELEQAQDAISSRATRVTIPRDNTVLLEGLQSTHTLFKNTVITQQPSR